LGTTAGVGLTVVGATILEDMVLAAPLLITKFVDDDRAFVDGTRGAVDDFLGMGRWGKGSILDCWEVEEDEP
jgi:hypothetical protein